MIGAVAAAVAANAQKAGEEATKHVAPHADKIAHHPMSPQTAALIVGGIVVGILIFVYWFGANK